MIDFTNRTVLVTGAARGIGRGVATAFAKNNANVVINYAHNAEAAEKLAEELRALHPNAKIAAYKADVSNFEQVKDMFATVKDEIGSVDVLVNNAGITMDKPFLLMDESSWRAVHATNLDGVFYCSKCAAKQMQRKKRGYIISMSSVTALVGTPGQSNYSSSKAGIIGLIRVMARELARYNITVNAVLPGYIDTEMIHKIPENVFKDVIDRVPLGRFGTPEEIANMILFLSSGMADYVTGQTLVVDGGFSA